MLLYFDYSVLFRHTISHAFVNIYAYVKLRDESMRCSRETGVNGREKARGERGRRKREEVEEGSESNRARSAANEG